MTKRLLIGCGAGFSGDRTDVAIPVVREMLRRREPAVLFFECLGERTLALAHLRRRENPRAGHEPLLEEMLQPVLQDCLAGGIAIVGNFGAANPREAARRIARLANLADFPAAAIAVVEGDDVTHLVRNKALEPMGIDQGLNDRQLICANAYLGAEPIARALAEGGQVVVTGRVADPSMVLGPAVQHFGWSWNDRDRMAAGTLAGHLLECGAQVTGGYFADPGFKTVAGLANIGFPIAEITFDGGITVTKPGDTGGLVTPATVKEQLLYEIYDPASYQTPDVVLDVTGVEIASEGPDRVVVTGARGYPRPDRLKVTVSVEGGWLGEGEISYAGPNAPQRAQLAIDILKARLPDGLRVRGDLIGVASVFAAEEGNMGTIPSMADDVRARIAVEAPTQALAERAVREVTALLCCGPAAGGGVRTQVRQRVNTWSATAPRAAVEDGVSVTLQPAHQWAEAVDA